VASRANRGATAVVSALPRPTLCLVTDRRRLAPTARTARGQLAALERQIDEAFDAGVDLIQIRERDLDARALSDLVRRVVGRHAVRHTAVVVNDRADVALAIGADGVHLGSLGAPVDRVRSLAPSWIVGRSVHQGDDLEPHRTADYLLFGAVFPTASKPGAASTGLECLRAAAAATTVPVLAIGGITSLRATECRRAGAAGIAAIGLFLPKGRSEQARGVHEGVRELRAAMADAS
jgi:thiamine-phosphate diphosphorylase